MLSKELVEHQRGGWLYSRKAAANLHNGKTTDVRTFCHISPGRRTPNRLTRITQATTSEVTRSMVACRKMSLCKSTNSFSSRKGSTVSSAKRKPSTKSGLVYKNISKTFVIEDGEVSFWYCQSEISKR